MRRRYDKLKFIEYLEEFPYISYAAKKSGISRATIYRWMKDDKDFREAVNGALSFGNNGLIDIAEMGLVSLIKEKNLGAIKYFLEHTTEKYKPTSNNAKAEKIQATKEELLELRENENKFIKWKQLTGRQQCDIFREGVRDLSDLIVRYEENGLAFEDFIRDEQYNMEELIRKSNNGGFWYKKS